MNKRILKKSIALLSICLNVFLCTMPAYAAESKIRYNVKSVVLSIPEEENNTSVLTGPDVREDGTLFLEYGKTYNFTWEASGQETWRKYGMNLWFAIQDLSSETDTFSALSLDGKELFAEIPEDGFDVKIDFENVSLRKQTKIEKDVPYIFLDGTIKMEIRGKVREIFTVKMPATENEVPAYYKQLKEEHTTQQLAEQQEIVYYLQYGGSDYSSLGTTEEEFAQATEHSVAIEFLYSPDRLNAQDEMITYSCISEYQGERYEFPKESVNSSNTFLRPFISVEFFLHEWAWEEVVLENDQTEKAIATAATAGALGLGGSAVANIVTGLSDDELPPVQKKHIYGEDEEEVQQNMGKEELPELPEEDTPDVSMSIYKPFKALVNTKGAAADLHITISGGEGLRWNYIPTAVCLDGMKAVVPTMVGQGEEATLVLAMTGAPMKKAHASIFVTVIAWAYTEAGQLVKTTGSAEIPLHAKGLEAKWTAEGKLQVLSYSDGNLDGVAEIAELTEDEYMISEEENGNITISAKKVSLGSVTISDKPKY